MNKVERRPELRGSHSAGKAIINKARVKGWMIAHPTSTMKECQEDLKLSHVTVRKYMRELTGSLREL